jgi:hypothetical protein
LNFDIDLIAQLKRGAALDLAIELFERIDGMDFRPVIFREADEGEHVGLYLGHRKIQHGAIYGAAVDAVLEILARMKAMSRAVCIFLQDRVRFTSTTYNVGLSLSVAGTEENCCR